MKKEYIQDLNTLRLLIMYNQFKDVEDVIFAFNVLQNKGNRKSHYITQAITHYDETLNDSLELTEALFPLRCMKFIRKYYGLKTKKSVKELLELGTNSSVFKTATDRMMKAEEPRPSLLGFNMNDPVAKATHDRLFQMDVSPRITLISAAIKKYVMDGNDSASLMACSYKLVHDSIIEYETSENKNLVVDNFYTLLKNCDIITEYSGAGVP